MPYQNDQDFSLKMQPTAIAMYYERVWPGSEIVELDVDRADPLKAAIDIAGADKMIRHRDGAVAFLAQRFRRHTTFDDFTLRYARPSGKTTELGKLQRALDSSGFIAGYYAYAHVNEAETDFTRFRILDYRRFAEMYVTGQLPQGQLRSNPDRTSFLAWPFSDLPAELFILNESGHRRPAQQLGLRQ